MIEKKQLSLLPYQVFISYAKDDLSWAVSLHHLLKAHGIRGWIDVEALEPGENWQLGITKAIKNCRYVLVLISTRSLSKQGYVQKEIREALDIAEHMPDEKIYIIPVRLEPCDVPERFAKWQWCDAFDENGRLRLVHFLKTGLGIPAFPFLKEYERELRATLSIDLVAEMLLLHKFAQAKKAIRTKDPGGELYITNGHCLEIRKRNSRFIQLFDQTFPKAEKLSRSYFSNFLEKTEGGRQPENLLLGVDFGTVPRKPRVGPPYGAILYTHAGVRCGIDEDYLSYIRLRYPAGKTYIRGPEFPILVEDNGKLRFIVMPFLIL